MCFSYERGRVRYSMWAAAERKKKEREGEREGERGREREREYMYVHPLTPVVETIIYNGECVVNSCKSY